MSENQIIAVNNLSFSFGNQKVLDNISLSVVKGSIYGFLGPNGSGKTTTIKLLLSLLKNNEHNISLFGKSLNQNREEVLKKVGSLHSSAKIHVLARTKGFFSSFFLVNENWEEEVEWI